MHINTLEIEGYRSYGAKQVIDLSKPGLVLLTGENHDRGKSSAAGKSTIFKALTTALFEENDDDSIKGNGINRLRPDEGYRIGVHFEADDGTPYYVVYAYRHPEAGSDWYIYRWDGIAWQDEREEKRDGTYDALQKILHMDYGQFLNRAYIAQEKVAEFISRTHKERLAIFSGILHLEVVDGWVVKARTWRRDEEKALLEGRGRAAALQSQWQQMQASLLSPQQIKTMTASLKTSVAQLAGLEDDRKLVAGALQELSNLVTLKATQSAAQADFDRLEDELSNMPLLGPVSNLSEVVKLAEEALHDLREQYQEAHVIAKNAQMRLDRMRALGGQCDGCERPIPESKRGALITKWEQLLTEAANKEKHLLEARDASIVHLQKMTRHATEYREKQAATKRVVEARVRAHERLRTANAQLGELQVIVGVGIDHDNDLQQRNEELVTMIVAETESMTRLQGSLKAATDAVKRSTKLEADYTREETANTARETLINKLKKVEAALGDKGFKSYKINRSRASFNNAMNRHLSLLSGGEIEAELVTEVAKADGKGLKSELDILVRDGEKQDVPIRQYSGGEKGLLSLAITGAFSDLSAEQAEGRVNVLLLDEPFANMDSWQEEMTCRLLESMRDSGRVILVVTNHHSVRERGSFDREIRAVKRDHITHIEEYDLSGEH